MTIRKGESWGAAGTLPAGSPVVDSDAALRAIVEEARRAGTPIPTVGLLGGDLCRTVGGRGDPGRLAQGGVVLPLDVGRVEIGGEVHWFTAHLVARRRLWLGAAAVVMNAQFLGPWDLGPRAHPNDGLLDLTEGRMPLGDRAEARRRARTGTHLPHPALRTARAARHELTFPAPVGVWLDGVRVASSVQHLVVEVEPDAATVVV